MACCCPSGDAEDAVNREIDQQLKLDRMKMDNEVKLLLLGSGESGKSTIVKQMKIIHMNGYTDDERRAFRDIIFSNTIQSMRALLAACTKFNIDVAIHLQKEADIISSTGASGEAFTPDVIEAIKLLWKDEGIQAAFEQRAKFQLNDSAQYYFESIDRIGAGGYVPSEQDVLRSRVRTTGIVETQFEYGGLRFRMFDVGGQKNERKKWIHCFQGVTAVIFVVAISEYDQVLFEDETVNRMTDSLRLFNEICNSRWFTESSMILFLNKIDLFKEKIQKIDPSCAFPEYTGGLNYDAASTFIRDKFISCNRNSDKAIYPHYTCATDTKNVSFVFEAVKDTILQANLRASGFV